MTRINRLVLHGFKSFAKRTELVFGKDFNCILGPNGSGKSNVLDALCFVLGKSSAKSMRAEKSSNLIYNGGKTKKQAKQAEVSIYFDNSNKIFPTDDPEVKITRLVRANGQGVYKINDETRTRSQIIELLSLARIDPDGYNIILQGDIVRLIDMTPNERRQIIEEIAGIGVYEEKKQKALNELGKVESKLKEAEIVLTERETYLKELKKERDQAQKYKDLESKLQINKATALHRQIKQKEAEKEELDERNNKHKTKLEKTSNEITDLKKEIEERKISIETINKEIEQKGEKEQVELHKEVEGIKIELTKARSRIENCRDEIAKIKTRKNNLKENIIEIDEKLKQSKQEKIEFERDIQTRQKNLKEIEEKLINFKKKNKMDDIGKIDEEIDKLDIDAEEYQKKAVEIRQKQQDLLREKDKIEFQLEAIDEKINKVLEVEKENKEQIDELKQKKTEFKKTTMELSQIQAQEQHTSAELGDSRRKLLDANEELSKLNGRQAQIQEKMGANIAVKRILENKSEFKGVYGTVSELGEVGSKYALALEVAAGHKIKSIVVEDDKVAAQCINYLKKNKLGIATFLPLNKVRSKPISPNAARLTGKQGVHGLAVELISYDAKFANVFKYVFESTVIVDGLNTARAIGIGTAKMVTIDGDTAEMSGAMSGGFRQKREGAGFGEKELTLSIKKYETIQAEMGGKIVKLESRKNEMEEKIFRLREHKANIEGDIIKLEKVLHLDQGDMEASKKVKDDLNKQLKKVEEETDKIMNLISDNNSVLAENKIKRQQLRDQVGQLRSPTLIAELNAFEEKKRDLREALIKLESEVKNINTRIQTMLEPEHENINKIIKQHEKETEAFKQEIDALEEQAGLMNKDLKEKEKKEKEFYAQFKDLFNKRTKFSDEVSKRESKMYVLTDDVRKIEHKINAINLEVAKISAQMGGLLKEFEQYEGVEIDNEKTDSQLTREINQFTHMADNLGTVNLRALEIYDTVEKEYRELNEKKALLEQEKEDVVMLMNEIEGKKKILFMKTLEALQENFQNIFSTLLTKGEASLVLENPENPFEGGMLIRVRIAGTKFLDIRSLSGGEKTMTALAFLFSVQEYDPASFYVLDEVDAALDKKNSEKLAELIKKYCDKAQYVMISHNDGIIAEADRLYGISMDEHGVSKAVSMRI